MHTVLEEKVYMRQPTDYKAVTRPRFVCKLQKALNGMKHAPLSSKLQALGFSPSRAYFSLFISDSDGKVLYVLIDVGDIIGNALLAAAIQN
jgi:hypothetical protein